MKSMLALTGSLALLGAAPVQAQNVENLPAEEETVFDGDWFSIGLGAVYSASYDGSDDYVFSPIPIV